MKPVIKQEEATYYVSDAELISFICENSDMSWNKICDYVREESISSNEHGSTYWDREDVFEEGAEAEYNPNAIRWMREFFNAHPFMDRVMMVFDD